MSKFKKGDTVWLGRDLHTVEAVMPNNKYQLDGVLTYIPEDWLDPFVEEELPESQHKISLAKLREVLNGMADTDGFVVETPDNIINRIKRELR